MEHLMPFVNILLILLSVGAIFFLIIKSGIHSKKSDDIKRRFLEEEDAANSARKKEIEPELYYTANLTALPPISADDPHQVMRCAARPMIRFPKPMTNLEIKKTYGPSQMDIIAQYEENFSEYLKALTKWAAELKDENHDEALTIVETVISLGGEFRNAYKLAADIYAATGRNLSELASRTEENHFSDPIVKQQILDYISGAPGAPGAQR